MTMPQQMLPWRTMATETLLELPPWFSVLRDRVQLPSGRIVNDYHRIEAPDYALICARDGEGRILLERHYKQCLGRFILTLPAGGIDQGEAPLAAAQRELLEETGYRAGRWQAAGAYTVDGTRGICRAHLFFADELSHQSQPCCDEMEQFELLFYERRQIAGALAQGTICLLPDIALLSLAYSTLFD